MAVNYLLDTDIASYAVKQTIPRLRLRLKHVAPESVFLSTATIAEMLFGLKSFPQGHPLITATYQMIDLAHIIDWDLNAAQAYADIRHSLTLSANLIGELEMMIAAQALSRDFTLVSNNIRHFSRVVPPLRLENWTEA